MYFVSNVEVLTSPPPFVLISRIRFGICRRFNSEKDLWKKLLSLALENVFKCITANFPLLSILNERSNDISLGFFLLFTGLVFDISFLEVSLIGLNASTIVVFVFPAESIYSTL